MVASNRSTRAAAWEATLGRPHVKIAREAAKGTNDQQLAES
jgi:hypothetical protein